MFSSKPLSYPVDLKTGFYNRRFFNMRLREERLRTERVGSPFSLLTLDIASLMDLTKSPPKLRIHKVKKVITNIVQQNTRDIDIKSWHDDTTLKILMPETPISGAYVVAEKLQHKVNNSLQSGFGFDSFFQLDNNMVITYYPEVIKNSEEFSQSENLPKSPMNPLPTNSPEKGKTRKNRKMQWNPIDQIALAWPFYSDLLEESVQTNFSKLIKRIFDIAGALIGIVLLSPFMFIIAILIKLTCSGPILFKQERMGFLGKKFTFLKFRSMNEGCDEKRHREYVTDFIENKNDNSESGLRDKPLYKMEDDPRLTPFGKFLRRSSLDELPQLFNVLTGKMSLVGPRPPISYEVEKYDSWHLRRVLEVKPGITGLWQVTGRSTTTFNEMVRLDISYADNWSLWMDLKIILKTIWAVVSCKGAY